MYSLNFVRIHRYLFGLNDKVDPKTGLPITGVPDYPLLDKDGHRQGIHLCRHQVFSSGSLAFICYARNTFNAQDQLTGVKVCLKLLAGKKNGRNKYASPHNPEETIAMEFDLDDLRGIYSVLKGRIPEYYVRTVRRGETAKEAIFSYQPESQYPWFIEMKDSALKIKVTLTAGDVFEATMVILATLKVHYPVVADEALLGALLLPESENTHLKQPIAPLTVNEPGQARMPILKGSSESEADMRQKKAIYAIGRQKWGGAIEAVQYIQKHVGFETAQALISAGNSGDFTIFDQVARGLSNGSEEC